MRPAHSLKLLESPIPTVNIGAFIVTYTTVDGYKSCGTHNKEYTMIPILYGREGSAGLVSSTVFWRGSLF